MAMAVAALKRDVPGIKPELINGLARREALIHVQELLTQLPARLTSFLRTMAPRCSSVLSQEFNR